MLQFVRLSTLFLLAGVLVGCAASSSDSDQFATDYQFWGEETNWGRSPDDKWADGSNWFDGVSDTPPSLPLADGAPITGNVSCAQEEVIYSVIFPKTDDWHKGPDYLDIVRQHKRKVADTIWGGNPTFEEAESLLDEPGFSERCGEHLEPDPSAPLSPAKQAEFEKSYQSWGEDLYSERSADVKWQDGSNWTDGTSHTPPDLPLPRGRAIKDSAITCAQEEIINMTAFPEGEDIETWHLESDANVIGLRWEANFAKAIWGDYEYSTLRKWLNRSSFSSRCGSKMQ